MQPFFKQFTDALRPGQTVIDVGAGLGTQSKKLHVLGMHVLAIDTKEKPDQFHGDAWHETSIETWVREQGKNIIADAWLLKNILQFLDKSFVLTTLLPYIAEHTANHGVVAIETFTKAPEPPFKTPNRSYYGADEVLEVFNEWNILRKVENEKTTGKDMAGNERTFYLTQVIMKKRGRG